MKLLAIESSGLTASAAVTEDGALKAEFTINNKLTHSETLLPMIREMFRLSGMSLNDIHAIAVSAGPGSFTGLRIGAATAKGLALAQNIPVISVPTLRSMGEPLSRLSSYIVCPIMDARRGEVYGAAYHKANEILAPGAYNINDYIAAIEKAKSGGIESDGYLFLGDGVDVHKNAIADALSEQAWVSAESEGRSVDKCLGAPEGRSADKEPGAARERVQFAGASYSRQRASLVAEIAAEYYVSWLSKHGLTADEVKAHGADAYDCYDDIVMNSDDFAPEYVRKSQAERENESGLLEDAGEHSLKKMRAH